jgi:hypothetical protein
MSCSRRPAAGPGSTRSKPRRSARAGGTPAVTAVRGALGDFGAAGALAAAAAALAVASDASSRRRSASFAGAGRSRRGWLVAAPRRAGRDRGWPGARRRLPAASLRGRRMSQPRDSIPRLPHAAPFLLLDRVIEVGERSGAFSKLVSAADPCVGSDGRLPAAFVLEALAQGCGALLAELEGTPWPGGYLAGGGRFPHERRRPRG